MKIDIFNHVFPKAFFDRYIISGAAGKEIGKRMANATLAFDLDHRFVLGIRRRAQVFRAADAPADEFDAERDGDAETEAAADRQADHQQLLREDRRLRRHCR